jgi:hypothetical protein
MKGRVSIGIFLNKRYCLKSKGTVTQNTKKSEGRVI